jgi:hypothetical protein
MEEKPADNPFRFSLRTLFLIMTGVAILAFLMPRSEPLEVFAIVYMVMLLTGFVWLVVALIRG